MRAPSLVVLGLLLLLPAARAQTPESMQDWAGVEEVLTKLETAQGEERTPLLVDLFTRTGEFLDRHLGKAPPDECERAAGYWLNLALRSDVEPEEVERRVAQVREKLVPMPPPLERACQIALARVKVRPGTAAPAWKARLVHGEGELDSKQLQGKLVLLDFWATWCGPCIALSKSRLAPLSQQYGDALVIVGVGSAQNDTAQKQAAAAEKHGLAGTKVFDQDESMGLAFGVDSLPYLCLIDGEGKVLVTGPGARVIDEIEATLAKRLGGERKPAEGQEPGKPAEGKEPAGAPKR